MNKRSLMTSTALPQGFAIPTMPRLEPGSISTLYGDGVHDDTLALQAAIEGRPYYRDGRIVQRSPGSLPNGTFKVSAKVTLP